MAKKKIKPTVESIEQKIETTPESSEKRVLVIDDEPWVRRAFERYGKGRFECPGIGGYLFEATSPDRGLSHVETLLRTVPYAAILMDGKLELRLSDYECDGAYLARRITSGDYGLVCQKTPIYNISSAFTIPGSECRLPKDCEKSIEHTVNLIERWHLQG